MKKTETKTYLEPKEFCPRFTNEHLTILAWDLYCSYVKNDICLDELSDAYEHLEELEVILSDEKELNK
jgi:hypothetical protein